ncbi:hypothetical protein KSS87_020404 [Heliosperma pusillum]|nr:hypothetical protein KSS87_020404 [Heliosperma pusillum]
MHHLWSLSPQTPLPFHTLTSHSTTTTDNLLFSSFSPVIRRRNYHPWRVSATEQEPKFEVDQEKARQALNDLDLQLESLSKKQINPPKIKASSLANLKVQLRDEPPEITGSVLGYFAFILFVFSIFYNIIFITVIRPYIDGPDDIAVANVAATTEASTERQP